MKKLLLSSIVFTITPCSQLLSKVTLSTPKAPHESVKKCVPLDKKHSSELPFKQNKTNKIAENLDQLFDKASKAINSGKLDEAIEWYNKIIKEYPTCEQAYLNRGVVLAEQKKHVEAIEDYKKALALKPEYTKANLYMAQSCKALSQYDDAISFYKKALALNPELSEAHKDLSHIFTEQEKFYEAIEHVQAAVRRDPENMHLTFELANLYNMVNKTEEALELYYTLLVKYPENPSILYNIAYTLKKMGKIAEALPFYQATLAKNPNHAEAQFSLGLLYLTNGDFDAGWPLYEWRWKRDVQLTPRHLSKPEWDGSDLTGKTILLHAEQGLGDTFQFIRYAQAIKERYHARVVVAVQEPLYDIISLCPYIDQLVKLQDHLPYFDVHVALLSVPHILKTNVKTIPVNIPYLYADEELVANWREKMGHDANFKIGICYQGNTKYSTPFLRAAVAAKSLLLEQFTPLSHIENVSIYCLQKDTGTDQLDNASWNLIMFDEDFDQTHGRFMDTAAIMKNLDLIVTIDTSIAHLAGGLGVPVWILIPNPPDWRWMLERNDTPWYPNMRLFRQSKSGDWDSVINSITSELEALINQKSQSLLPQKSLADVAQSSDENKVQLIARLHSERNIVIKQLQIAYKNIQDNVHRDLLDIVLMEQIRSFYVINKLRITLDEQIALLQKQTVEG